jgi:uncharacterized iron-regulated membrane protein
MRWLVLIHRYLGIAIGILMAAWCLSGIVMMYVGYPEVTRTDRLRALRPLELRDCCASLERTLPDDAQLLSFQLEMLAGQPVLRVRPAAQAAGLIDLRAGRPIGPVPLQQAQAVAADFAVAAGAHGTIRLQQTLDYDQWTLEGVARGEPPLYRFAANDADGTQAYVSVHTGRLVQTTTARQRFWNWLGAIPHWLYFANLRHNGPLWTRLVVWSSLAGSFLALTGLYLGIQRFVRRPRGLWSPYRGLLLWHHVPGFIAGVFALTWVVSGLISMNPWGFLDSTAEAPEPTLLSGLQVKQALAALARARLPQGCVSVDSAPLNGRLYLIASAASGLRTRLDSQGSPSPLSAPEVGRRVREITGADISPELLTHEDAYYFSHHRNVVALPVYRAVASDAQQTRYYIDAVSGALTGIIDGNTRWYRWLHQGLHRMDFTPMLRARPLWDVIMWVLMSAVTTICCTGAILGIRRLR